MQDLEKQSELFKARRRQLLRMGAAGMPMVLTLRASASQALISQLQCVFVIPKGTKILVGDRGQAWVGSGKLRNYNDGLKLTEIEDFKASAAYHFHDGTVSENFRPEACGSGPCEDNWYGSLENADVDSMFAHLTGGENDYLAAEGFSGAGSKGKGHSNHIHCDKHGQQVDGHHHVIAGSEYTSCGYKKYGVSNKSVKPGDYVSENGNWNLSGGKGLYIELSIKYADSHGQSGGWPGISCIVSILNYLNP
tara:strand:+ start:741 stop:1490 length:750 start_codon:yes stop_codon:yes gene_type:complete